MAAQGQEQVGRVWCPPTRPDTGRWPSRPGRGRGAPPGAMRARAEWGGLDHGVRSRLGRGELDRLVAGDAQDVGQPAARDQLDDRLREHAHRQDRPHPRRRDDDPRATGDPALEGVDADLERRDLA